MHAGRHMSCRRVLFSYRALVKRGCEMIASMEELRERYNELSAEEIAAIVLTCGTPELVELVDRYYANDIETEEFICEAIFGG